VIARLAAACLALVVSAEPLAAQMPDLREMSGVPLPSGDLPNGVVSVRVVRESLGNNQPGVPVVLEGDGVSTSADTDDAGRAIFSGLRAGATLTARVVAGGETARSQPFQVPSTGGVRLILALGLDGAGAAGPGSPSVRPPAGQGGGAARPGGGAALPEGVVFGPQTRTIVEVIDEALEVFHVFEIANIAAEPFDPGSPIEIHMPDGAVAVTLLEGSTPQARVFERRLVIAAPFAPGRTMAQVAYRLPYEGPRQTIALTLPLPLMQTQLIVRQVGSVRVVQPELPQSREAEVEGRRYLTAAGPGLNAGETLSIQLDGLPHHPAWPVYTAIGVSLLLVAGGLWLAFLTPIDPALRVRALEARREQLLHELRQAEQEPQDAGASGRGARSLEGLEGVYAMIDAERAREVPPAPPRRRAS
jgi:hypothetical protein